MNYFPNNDEEISLIKFIAQYQYLNISDAKYFFKTKKYYRNRINNLISKRFIRKIKSNLVLEKLGIEYSKLFKFEYNKLNRNKKYKPRLLYLSHLAAFYHNCSIIKFTPSFAIKDKEMFTMLARKYIGIIEVNGIDYLAYYISKCHDKKYLASVIYDIQKEKIYKNIIVFIDDINRIKTNEFAFGKNQVLIIEYTEDNLKKLEYLHSINWDDILFDVYKTPMFLAEYNFCDYTDHKNRFIAVFYFLDTEKITRLQYFLRENRNRNVDIICSMELEKILRKELPNANYNVLDIEKYIDKERNIYE